MLTNNIISFEQLGPERQTWANGVNPEQMPQNMAASDQNLHCLPLIQQF